MAGKQKDKLSPKERAFCLAYISLKEGQAAAIKAGYSVKTAASKGSQLLRKVKVRAEIDRLEGKVETKAIITKQRVLDELACVGFADMKDYAEVLEGGVVKIKPFSELPEGATRAIGKLKERRSLRVGGEEGDTIIDVAMEFAHHDKIAALKEISKLNDYYPAEKQEVKHSGTVTVQTVNYAQGK